MMDPLSGVVPCEKPPLPVKPTIKTADSAKPFEPLDERRQLRALQEYLCRLNEVRDWLVDCIGEEGIPKATDLEDHLRSGVILAKIANYFEPNIVPLERIFDIDNVKYIQNGAPSYRHTDNIIAFRNAALSMRLPEVVVPETVDVYEGRNIRTIFCLYALAIRLFRQRKAPPIRNKFGTIQFTEKELESVKERFARFNQNFGNFSLGNLTVLCSTTKKSFSLLENGDEDAIVQSLIAAISEKNAQAVSVALSNCRTLCVDRNLIEHYIEVFLKEQDDLKENDGKLSAEDLRRIVHNVNVDYCLKRLVEYIRSQRQDLDEMSLILMELCGAEQVMEISLPLYRRVLAELLRERIGGELSLDDVSTLLETCNACMRVKIALLDEDRDELMDALRNPVLDVKFLSEDLRDEYFRALLVAYEDGADMYATQIQVAVENVNNTHVQLEQKNPILRLCDSSANFLESPFLSTLAELDPSMAEHLLSSKTPSLFLMHYLNELAALKDKSLLNVDDVRQTVQNGIEDFQLSTEKAIFAFRVNKAAASETDRQLLAILQSFAAAFGLHVEAVVAQWYVSALCTELSRRFGESGRSIVVECASENCRYGRIIAVESKNGEAMSIVTKYVEDQEAVDKKEAALTFDEIVLIVERANAAFANHYEVVGAEKVRKCQREVRRFVRKRRLKKRERAARVIQHAFRQHCRQKKLAEFDNGKLPSSLSGLREFLLLKGTAVDYLQELEIERTRTRMKQLIFDNQRLNKEVTSLDKQIGFLVKNLIVHPREKLEANKVDGDDEVDEASTSSTFGKSPEKCQNELLNHLEILFYTLQMEPKYLANLTNACLAKSRLSNPIEFYRRILLPIFKADSTTMRPNSGRDEALMAHLFEEILSVYISKLDNFGEFMDEEQNRHNSIALTNLFRVMLRSFHTDSDANSTSMMDELRAFVEDEPSNFNLNPLEIYQKIYGKAADSIDTALADIAVVDVLESSKFFALKWANRWASVIYDINLSKCALNLLRFCADALERRFPKTANSSAELNRCTALFLYRTMLNHLPDYIGELADGNGTSTTITMRQMELLRAILNILGISLSGRGFGDDASFLKSMNHELRSISERFSEHAVNVIPSELLYPSAECLLASDTPSTLKIALKDLQNILQLIVEHRQAIDADSKSSLQKLIDSVKYAWQAFDAKGYECLTLTLHPSISEAEEDDEKAQPSMSNDELLIATKSAIIKLLPQSDDCSTIDEMLMQSEEDGEEDSRNHLRRVAAENLSRMEGIEELRELVSNEYKLLLESIAMDIRRHASEKHCRERSQLLTSLQEAVARLETKRGGYTAQLEQYRNCLENCIENMTLRRPAIVLTGENKQGEKEIRRRLEQPAVTSLKISGEKLLRKSLLAASTRSNVSLKELSKLSVEVSQTDETKKKWIFELTIRKATKKSIKEEDVKVTLNLQDLLKAENEGRREFLLSPNVNLHPRNFRQYLMKKFYSKK